MSEPAKRTVSIRLDHAVYANACEIADTEGRSFNNWANRVIEYAITRAKVNPALRGDPGGPPLGDALTDPEAFRALQSDLSDVLKFRADNPPRDEMPPDMPDPVHRSTEPPGLRETLERAGIHRTPQEAPPPMVRNPRSGDLELAPKVRPVKRDVTPVPKKGGKR